METSRDAGRFSRRERHRRPPVEESELFDSTSPDTPYVVRYLTEHVAAADLWSELARDIGLLMRLDAESLRVEAFRSLFGLRPVPPGIQVAMVAMPSSPRPNLSSVALSGHWPLIDLG